MKITPTNRDTAIRNNIISTLGQIKDGAKANNPLVVPYQASGTVTVSFYLDSDRTHLFFTDNSATSPDSFGVAGVNTTYLPPDAKLNDPGTLSISQSFSQGLYYVTVAFADAHQELLTYRNMDNLLFSRVMVATDKNPPFAPNENLAVIVPQPARIDQANDSDDRGWMILTFDVYLQQIIYDWSNLSEAQRLTAYENAANLVRLALYADKFRAGNATFYSKDINGTNVSPATPLPSKDVLKAKMTVQCAFMVGPRAY